MGLAVGFCDARQFDGEGETVDLLHKYYSLRAILEIQHLLCRVLRHTLKRCARSALSTELHTTLRKVYHSIFFCKIPIRWRPWVLLSLLT